MRLLDLGPDSGGSGGGSTLRLYAGALPVADGSATFGAGPTAAGYAVGWRIEITGGYGPGSTVELLAGAAPLIVFSAETPIRVSGDQWLAIGAVSITATIAGATLAGSGTAGAIAT